MTAPIRLQLKRTKDFRLQEVSQAANGFPAIKVDRSTMYGNPFVVSREGRSGHECAQMYRQLLSGDGYRIPHAADPQEVFQRRMYALGNLTFLRGKNLACWCKIGDSCHADVLLELANRPTCEEVQP